MRVFTVPVLACFYGTAKTKITLQEQSNAPTFAAANVVSVTKTTVKIRLLIFHRAYSEHMLHICITNASQSFSDHGMLFLMYVRTVVSLACCKN
jgi:hypothetical protein